jgi:hypothetical protein
MIAKTNRRWIMLPRLNTKKPSTHPINKMTAIKYNNSLITFLILFMRIIGNNMPLYKSPFCS